MEIRSCRERRKEKRKSEKTDLTEDRQRIVIYGGRKEKE
jgi:hypothetical protein